MIAIWYAVVSFMLIVYIVLDGRNFGAGMLLWFVAKTLEERRQVIAAIGPLWTWHEVWLLGFGGTLIAIFPKLMASAFAGYYLALMLILWCLILRGVSIEVGGHINDRLWQAFWDFVFVLGNTLLAILFGAAAGNLVRGVPLDADGNFSMAFFTNFRVRGHVGLLDWYTVSIAIFAAVILAAHGANYLTLKTEGPVHDRSAMYANSLWRAVAVLIVLITAETWVVRPDLFSRAVHNPFGWLGLLVITVSTIALISGLRDRREMRACAASDGGRSHSNRPDQPSRFPAAALSGRDFGPELGTDWLTDPRDLAEAEEYDGRSRRSHGCEQGAALCGRQLGGPPGSSHRVRLSHPGDRCAPELFRARRVRALCSRPEDPGRC